MREKPSCFGRLVLPASSREHLDGWCCTWTRWKWMTWPSPQTNCKADEDLSPNFWSPLWFIYPPNRIFLSTKRNKHQPIFPLTSFICLQCNLILCSQVLHFKWPAVVPSAATICCIMLTHPNQTHPPKSMQVSVRHTCFLHTSRYHLANLVFGSTLIFWYPSLRA